MSQPLESCYSIADGEDRQLYAKSGRPRKGELLAGSKQREREEGEFTRLLFKRHQQHQQQQKFPKCNFTMMKKF